MSKWLVKVTGLRASRRGQTVAEYGIIVALVALCSIAIIMIFGDQLRALFSAGAQRMGSNSEVTVDTSAAGQADSHKAGDMTKF